MLQVEGEKKKKVGLDHHLVGSGLSLFRSFTVSDAVVIPMRQKHGLTSVKLCVVP